MFSHLAVSLAILSAVLANPIPELSDNLITKEESISNDQNPVEALFYPDENVGGEDRFADSTPEVSQNLLSDFSSVDEPSLDGTPGTECTSAASANDILDQSIQERSIHSRLQNACPSDFLSRPPGSNNGNGRSPQSQKNGKTKLDRDPTHRAPEHKDPENPCARNKDSRHQHVTCKGPAIGSSLVNADHVLDCVPGR